MSLHDFVATGDIHLDERSPRNADRLAALDQIIEENVDRDTLGAWLLLGDFVRGLKVPLTIGDRNALDARFMRMAQRAPVVVIYGNHDADGDLEGFANLRGGYPIYVVDRPHVLSLRLATGAMASIACLPYPRRAGLITAGTTADQTLEAGNEALFGIVRGLALELHDAQAKGEITLSIAHLNIGGSVASTGQPQIGREIELAPAGVEALREYGPFVLGHIHKPQEIHGAYYVGSVCRMDFGEVEEKRCLMFTFDDEIVNVEPGWDIRWCVATHPLDVPPMFHVEGELTRDSFHWTEGDMVGDVALAEKEAMANGPFCPYAGSDVRVRFSYRPAEKDVLDFELVKAPFAGARLLKIEPVPILDQAIRAPAVIAATNLTDQVKAYCAEQGIAVTEGLLAKLDALQASEAEASPLEVAS